MTDEWTGKGHKGGEAIFRECKGAKQRGNGKIYTCGL